MLNSWLSAIAHGKKVLHVCTGEQEGERYEWRELKGGTVLHCWYVGEEMMIDQ